MLRRYLVGFLLLLSLVVSHNCVADHAVGADLDDDEDWDADTEFSDGAAAGSGNSVGSAHKALMEVRDANVEKVIASHEHVLLLGYASWCTRSSTLLPEFAAAASELSSGGSNVLLVKLDAISNPRAASLYNIKGFPHLLFFINGTAQLYNGGLSRDELINWVQKRTGNPTNMISSHEEALNILNQNATIVVGFFESREGPDYEQYVEVAKNEVGTQFIETINLDVAKDLNLSSQKFPPTIWILKNEPEYLVPYDGNFNYDEIMQFIEVNKHPLVVELTSENMAKVYSSPVKIQVLLFCEFEDYESLLALFLNTAKIFKGKLLFLHVDTADEELSRPMLALYGLDPDNLAVAGFDYRSGSKYLLDAEVSDESLKAFCSGLLKGNLPQHFKSKPIPTSNEGDLRVVVGKSFKEIVLDESKDVFLEVTMPWCLLCKAADKVFHKLAKVFKEAPSLVIATIDASLNEHPLLKVDSFPEFLFYPAGRKDAPPVVAPSNFKIKQLVEFVRKNAAIPISSLHTEGANKRDEVSQRENVDETSEGNELIKEEL